MSVKLRLARYGSKKNPVYRVVAADSRSPRDGRFIEIIGQYNPQTDPSTINLDKEKAQKWLLQGAQPTNTVGKLLEISGLKTKEPKKAKAVNNTAKKASKKEPKKEASKETKKEVSKETNKATKK